MSVILLCGNDVMRTKSQDTCCSPFSGHNLLTSLHNKKTNTLYETIQFILSHWSRFCPWFLLTVPINFPWVSKDDNEVSCTVKETSLSSAQREKPSPMLQFAFVCLTHDRGLRFRDVISALRYWVCYLLVECFYSWVTGKTNRQDLEKR